MASARRDTTSAPAFTAAPRRFTLQFKTMIGLLTLLIAAVFLSGFVFLRITGNMVHASKRAQTSQLAYALAATLGSAGRGGSAAFQPELDRLERTLDLDFVVLTDLHGMIIASYQSQPTAARVCEDYLRSVGDRYAARAGDVTEFPFGSRTTYILSVPVFAPTDKPGQGKAATTLVGYLHVAVGNEAGDSQFRYLQGWILLTCMGIVLVSLPAAALIARHITVPIRTLAHATHTLAAGDLSHRVTFARTDELGELAASFNAMADRVQEQQGAITQINAGLEAKVQQRTAEIELVNDRLKAEISEKEDFLRAVSHDLNAPLRNIAGMASMLVLKYQTTLEKDAVQRLERIQKNVEVECELINELLELSRIKTRREKIERIDLHDLVTGITEQLSNDLETRGIALRINGRLPVMECEKARLRQVFQNLIDNGIKYMRQDGPKEIVISMEQGPQEVTFLVRDTGIGIAQEDLPFLFHVFRRARSASVAKIPGKGVGLASVKSIVENYNGRISVESNVGEGTTFRIAIPNQHFRAPKQEVAA